MQGGEQRIFVDLSSARESIDVNRFLRAAEEAIDEKRLLKIHYTNANNFSYERVIEPLALSYQWYAWYLFAFCPQKSGYRLFKLSRILCMETISGFFSQEHGDVETLMRSHTSSDKRKYFKARLLCEGEIKQQVMEYLSSNIIEEHKNGDFVIEINLPFERMWFSLLLGFGSSIKVIDCNELRDMLKEKAKEILSAY